MVFDGRYFDQTRSEGLKSNKNLVIPSQLRVLLTFY